jgi:hypothetical protein
MPEGYPYRRRTWLQKLRPSLPPIPPRELSRWIPDTHILIHDALNLIGEQSFPGWNGSESKARWWMTLPPDSPSLWEGNRPQDGKFIKFTEKDEVVPCSKEEAEQWWQQVEPQIVEEWKAERDAEVRWTKCLNLMRNRLADKTYEAFALEENGYFYEVPVEKWLGKDGEKAIRTGVVDFFPPSYGSSSIVRGPAVLRHDFLRTTPNKIPNPDEALDNVELKRFPYLGFLLQAARSGVFKGDEKVQKKTIEHWLRSHWPPDLGSMTETKIATLATYLRRPEDEKGGLKK